MTRTPRRSPRKAAVERVGTDKAPQADFEEVLSLIDSVRTRALAAVNTVLIDLYWQIGEQISRRIAVNGWGQGTVEDLAEYIRIRQPNARGFSAQNLWRMRQFHETYRDRPKLSALLRELTWTHNLLILGKCKREEEREFYLVKKPHEQPSIGVLLCATKNHEVVEYALSRSMSPALVSEYQTRLPDKKLLQAKLHEFYALAQSQAESDVPAGIVPRPVARLPAAANPRKVRKNS